MKDRKTLIDITLGSDNMPDIIMVKKNGVKTRFIPDLGQPDPYAHLREAQKRGETIQACNGPDGDWYDLPKYGLIWDNLELGEAPQLFSMLTPTATASSQRQRRSISGRSGIAGSGGRKRSVFMLQKKMLRIALRV